MKLIPTQYKFVLAALSCCSHWQTISGVDSAPRDSYGYGLCCRNLHKRHGNTATIQIVQMPKKRTNINITELKEKIDIIQFEMNLCK